MSKLFVLVDKRLSRSQQTVQACHAVAEFVKEHGKDWKHESMVLLAVDGEDALSKWLCRLNTGPKSCFYEPYWDNRLTAIAAYGCDEQVKGLNLL
jgi:hypothetical protein